MPDHRLHRGAHPEDVELFAADQWPALQTAAADLRWLLDHGYALRSSLALTGDRYGLSQRQRLAVARCACSREQYERRDAHRVELGVLNGRELWIDGYNLLISIESALSGGVLLLGRDNCYRDMASLHGTYRQVTETAPAAELIGKVTANWGVTKCCWLLDRTVANSGRLKDVLLRTAEASGWAWQIELEFSPDHILSETNEIVASSDSVVLDHCQQWCNAARTIIETHVPRSRVVDLSGAA